MGILFTSPTGGNVVSAADFAMPASLKIAGEACFKTDYEHSEGAILVCDQPATGEQKFLVRINPTTYKLAVTFYNNVEPLAYPAETPFHFYSTYALTSTDPQVVAWEIDRSVEPATVKVGYYSANAPGDGFVIETLAELNAYEPTGSNDFTNPIVDGADASGDQKLFGTLYWRAIRDQWAGDSAVNAMLGKTTPGVLRHTLQYSTGHIRHYREFNSGKTTDPFTGDVATITGGSFVSDPSGVEPMAVLAVQPDATTGKDAWVVSNLATTNHGASTTVRIGATAANFMRRAFWEYDLIALGFPADAVFSSFIHRLEGTALTGDPTQLLEYHRVTQAFTEGTGTGTATGDGVTWNTYDGSNNWAVAGGDLSTPIVAAGDMTYNGSDSVGTHDHDIADLANDAMQNRSGILRICLKRVTENNSTNGIVDFATSDNATAGNRPEIIGTYEVTSEFLTAEINSDGESFALAFQTLAWDTAAFNGDATDIEFTVTRDGSPVVITGTGTPTIAVAGQTLIEGDLDGVIYSGETVTVSFPAGLILDADGRTCEGGTNEAVTNGSAEAAPAAGGPDLTLGGAASCASNSR